MENTTGKNRLKIIGINNLKEKLKLFLTPISEEEKTIDLNHNKL